MLPALRFFNLMRAIEMHLMVPYVRRVDGWRVLDVGCGHGPYSLVLAQRGATLLGCDLKREALFDANETAQGLGLNSRALFMAADGTILPLPDGQVDLVICNCVLEHIADDRAALAAMVRCLKPGGTLYLTVDNADHGLALGFLERLPTAIRNTLLWPEIAAAPTVYSGLDERLDDRFFVLRRYDSENLANTLTELGLTVISNQVYLTGVGAAHFEAFHALRGLDLERGIGRLVYMLSSLVLYPLVVWSDSRRNKKGRGIALVARMSGEHDR